MANPPGVRAFKCATCPITTGCSWKCLRDDDLAEIAAQSAELTALRAQVDELTAELGASSTELSKLLATAREIEASLSAATAREMRLREALENIADMDFFDAEDAAKIARAALQATSTTEPKDG